MAANQEDQAPTDAARRPPAAKPRNAAASALGATRRPIQSAVATLLAHELDGVETSAVVSVSRHATLAASIARQGVRHAASGYRDGKAHGESLAAAARARTVTVDRDGLANDGNALQMRADLQALAQHDKTALNLNARHHPVEVGRAFDTAHSAPGSRTTFDLNALGIRATPNLKRALQEYASGGREELVQAGLVGPRAAEGPAAAVRFGEEQAGRAAGRQRPARAAAGMEI